MCVYVAWHWTVPGREDAKADSSVAAAKQKATKQQFCPEYSRIQPAWYRLIVLAH